MKSLLVFITAFFLSGNLFSQEIKQDTLIVKKDTLIAKQDTIIPIPAEPINLDTLLRIINLNPFFTLQVDSTLMYDLQINKPSEFYFWYLKNAPIGVKIDKNTGLLYFKAEKSYFKSGKLKYDIPYKVEVGVQNLRDAKDRIEESFTIMFYSTEVVVSRLKPTIGNTVLLEEGDSIKFRVQCETGSFPVEQITINSNLPISNFKSVNKCDDEFGWMVPYDFIRDNDTARQKILVLQFIGTDKFRNSDTATVRVFIRPGINYPQKNQEHLQVTNEMKKYVTNLKLTFFVISTNIKKTKNTRTGFDITGSSTAMLGTIISSTGTTTGAKNMGKVLPSVGLTLVPVKEAVSPNKVQEQNTASQVRATIKRLDYMMTENMTIGDRDPDILAKTRKLRDELKQSQLQLVDLPLVEFDPRYSQDDAEKYFNNPKVNKKYKLKVN
ncbi:MAG: hypothetical protein K9I92_04330 [Chitinophagaceae bacterium]|nr:hypothetical protein [Chitinophagaceae bacterium]